MQAQHYAVKLLGRLLQSRANRRGRLSAAALEDLKACQEWGWGSNIVGLFVGEKAAGKRKRPGELCLTVHVLRRLPMARLSEPMRIPPQLRLRGIESTVTTDVVELKRLPVLQAPAPGSKVGHYLNGSGCLGLYVQKKAGGPVLGLSCSHVVGNYGFGKPGEAIESPPNLASDTPTNRIGALTADCSVLSDFEPSEMDAAVFTIDAEPASLSVDGIGIPSALSRLDPIDIVAERVETIRRSVGGLCEGRVTGLMGRSFLSAPSSAMGRVLFDGLISYRTENFEGDSGAAVFRQGTTEVLGLHTGGDGIRTGYMTPISTIARRFGIQLPVVE